jgi:hypothetical protein
MATHYCRACTADRPHDAEPDCVSGTERNLARHSSCETLVWSAACTPLAERKS